MHTAGKRREGSISSGSGCFDKKHGKALSKQRHHCCVAQEKKGRQRAHPCIYLASDLHALSAYLPNIPPPSSPLPRPHLLQVAVLQQQLGGLISGQVVDAARIAQLLTQLKGGGGTRPQVQSKDSWVQGMAAQGDAGR